MTYPQYYFYNMFIYINTNFTNICRRVLSVLKYLHDKSICYPEVLSYSGITIMTC